MPNAQHLETAKRREARAVRLRAMGATFQQVADATLPCPDHQPDGDPTCRAVGMGCLPMYANRSAARKAVVRALEEEYQAGSETREQMRRHQLAQIDLLLGRAMADSVSGGNLLPAFRYQAMTAAARLLERRAKLLGLDAPTRVQVTSEVDAQIQALVDELAGQVDSPTGTA